MQLDTTPLKNKIIIQYFVGLGIVYFLTGFSLLTTGIFIILYSAILRPYFTWLISRCQECESIDNKVYAKLYAVISAASVLFLLSISAFDKEYFSSYKDTSIILLLAVGAAVFLYYFNLFSFGFEVNRFREHRKKREEKKGKER